MEKKIDELTNSKKDINSPEMQAFLRKMQEELQMFHKEFVEKMEHYLKTGEGL
jgi:hypothetical protein